MKKKIKIFGQVAPNGEEFIDGATIAQLMECMAHPANIQGALMPDAHFGYTLPIGGVVASDGMVFPSYVGYDQGCGVCAIPTTFRVGDIIQYKDLIYDAIHEVIPTGTNRHSSYQAWDEAEKYPHTKLAEDLLWDVGLYQLGTLGSGNHFLDIGYMEDPDRHLEMDSEVYFVIHSGSRKFGHSLATEYMKLASGSKKSKEGNHGFDPKTSEGQDFINDLQMALAYALANRELMIENVDRKLRKIGLKGQVIWERLINKTHNHIDIKRWEDGRRIYIHRKGATHSETGMWGVIPGNMKFGSFIGTGKGDSDSLWSSSHGAGRKFSRKKAKKVLDLEEFRESMKGIKAKVGFTTLDESEGAYKDPTTVMELQKDLFEVSGVIKPIINVKA